MVNVTEHQGEVFSSDYFNTPDHEEAMWNPIRQQLGKPSLDKMYVQRLI